jgi:hypothetical protein
MSAKNVQLDGQKVTVSFPQSLLQRLNECVPSYQQSRFIAAAIDKQLVVIEKRLSIEEQLRAIEEGAGAWSDEHHPEMKTGEDIDNWLNNFRYSSPITVDNGGE